MAGKKQAELTEAQKQCLRLVSMHYTSKQIARKLGISHYTVDQRIDIARMKLNADSRISAAKILAVAEGRAVYDGFVYEPEAVAYALNHAKPDLPTVKGHDVSNQQGNHFSISSADNYGLKWLALPPIGGGEHQLSKMEVMAAIIKTSTFSAIALSVLVITLAGLMNILA
jgi:DNA-binding CsgD family transcriptional regulator